MVVVARVAIVVQRSHGCLQADITRKRDGCLLGGEISSRLRWVGGRTRRPPFARAELIGLRALLRVHRARSALVVVLVELFRAPRTGCERCAVLLQLRARRRRQQRLHALRDQLGQNRPTVHRRRCRDARHCQPGRGVVNVCPEYLQSERDLSITSMYIRNR